MGLYVHFPWCVRKCPYCDFNSHPLNNDLPETEYVDALLADWNAQQHRRGERPINTVFFGGGTPSLFHPESFERLLDAIRPTLTADAEITMEANPGTLEYGNLTDYRAAGINRLSMGVQSFDDEALLALGRIHSSREAMTAIEAAQLAGFENMNLDLMHGLPGQTTKIAINDLTTAIKAGVSHISWYQLTIEPRTEFAKRPPALPDEDTLGDIETEGLRLLAHAGFERYEISAYSQPNKQARHNRNYWEFGDYLGLGAGAHGKTSERTVDNQLEIARTAQPRQPRLYLQQAASDSWQLAASSVAHAERPSEFMMNALRLLHGVSESSFAERTGINLKDIAPTLNKWRQMGSMHNDRLALTPLGINALDTIVADFL